MTEKSSKFIALVLRHKPEAAGVTLDAAGWTTVSALLKGMRSAGHAMTRAELEALVASDDKGRYVLSADGQRIRAQQGHSIPVELDLQRADPPALLYHGTVPTALDAIFAEGLKPMARHHVHLSPDIETAIKVGGRRGRPVVLVVDAAAMTGEGLPFWRSGNGVWLTGTVAPRFLRFHV